MNPAEVVLSALTTSDVPARVAEALPWVLMTFADLPWSWLVAQAKLAIAQNRLGYLVTLAKQAAGRAGSAKALGTLAEVEGQNGLQRVRIPASPPVK